MACGVALLCREFTQIPISATVGAALYAFNANKVAHAVGGHLPQVFTLSVPDNGTAIRLNLGEQRAG